MIRLSHTHLEKVRHNPSAYLSIGAQQPRLGRLGYVKLATRIYHEQDLDAAIEYVETGFRRRGFNMKHFDTYADYLAGYARAFAARGSAVIQFRHRVEIVGGVEMLLTGEIARLDLEPAGYTAWLFCEHLDPDWRNELRMPLLQHHTSKVMGAPLPEVRVGFYSFHEEAYDEECFDSVAVSAAQRELDRVALSVSTV